MGQLCFGSEEEDYKDFKTKQDLIDNLEESLRTSTCSNVEKFKPLMRMLLSYLAHVRHIHVDLFEPLDERITIPVLEDELRIELCVNDRCTERSLHIKKKGGEEVLFISVGRKLKGKRDVYFRFDSTNTEYVYALYDRLKEDISKELDKRVQSLDYQQALVEVTFPV